MIHCILGGWKLPSIWLIAGADQFPKYRRTGLGALSGGDCDLGHRRGRRHFLYAIYVRKYAGEID
jgi:hypothetical protein